MATLAQAVQLAEPDGFVRLFVEEAAALAPLLPLVRYAAPAFMEDLLFHGRDQQQANLPRLRRTPPVDPGASAWSSHSASTSSKCCAWSPTATATRPSPTASVITVGTAKWRIFNIYGKLGVRSRTQALSRARELNLL